MPGEGHRQVGDAGAGQDEPDIERHIAGLRARLAPPDAEIGGADAHHDAEDHGEAGEGHFHGKP